MASLPSLSRSFITDFHAAHKGSQNFSGKSTGTFPVNERAQLNRRIHLSREADHETKANYFHINEAPKLITGCQKPLSTLQDILHPTWYASDSDSVGNHHRSLQTYLGKLQNKAKKAPLNSESDITKPDDQSSQASTKLGALEQYLSTLEEDAKSDTSTSGRPMSDLIRDLATRDIETDQIEQQKGFPEPVYKRNDMYTEKSASPPLYDEKDSGNLYLISMLLAINIAVFLFEIASPIKSSDYDLYSLPMMYGAKVNDLIMIGEWWRLVTPMFLHSGFPDIALCSWVLFSFGPQVCKGYGSFTFLLIYMLGGISGNFSSFLHTSEPTVGGSGPVFAVIGAWLVYQIQNKESSEKELSRDMYQKAIIATALSFLLNNFGPVDNWTNLGAAVSGIIYGYFTRPVVLQVDDAASESIQERMKEEITLITQPANPCKSLIIFTVFLSILSSLLLFVESPLDKLELEELVRIIEW